MSLLEPSNAYEAGWQEDILMIDWNSPEVEEQSASIYAHLISVIQGIFWYVLTISFLSLVNPFFRWHFITTFQYVELPLLLRRMKFKIVFVSFSSFFVKDV